MRWYDRLMLVALTVAAAATVVALAVLGMHVSDVNEAPVPTTIVDGPPVVTPATVASGWVRCYHDDDTERWVPNVAVPAVGECT